MSILRILLIIIMLLPYGAAGIWARSRAANAVGSKWARSSAANVIVSKLSWTVNDVKVTVDGPVEIHIGGDRSEVKVTPFNATEGSRIRIFNDASRLEIGLKPEAARVPNANPPKVKKVEIWLASVSQSISIYGSSEVRLGNVDTTGLTVRHYGVGSVNAGVIDATSVTLELFGVCGADIRRIDGTTVNMALAGVGKINVGSIDGTGVKLTISGSGDADMGKVDCTNLDVIVSGIGHVKVGGDAVTARLYSNEMGSIDAAGLEASRIINTDFDKTGTYVSRSTGNAKKATPKVLNDSTWLIQNDSRTPTRRSRTGSEGMELVSP